MYSVGFVLLWMLLRYNKDLSMYSGKLLIYVMQVTLKSISPPAVCDEVLCCRVSLGFSVVKDVTMDQYHEMLGQKLQQVSPFLSPSMLEAQGLVRTHLDLVTHDIPIILPKEDPESISVSTKVRAN